MKREKIVWNRNKKRKWWNNYFNYKRRLWKNIEVDNISQKIEGIQINNIKVKENEIKEGEKVK